MDNFLKYSHLNCFNKMFFVPSHLRTNNFALVEVFEFFLIVFIEFAEISDKKYLSLQ